MTTSFHMWLRWLLLPCTPTVYAYFVDSFNPYSG
ncbi:hypothetical protein C7458_1125 [Williamsia muralis]|nr:hypothetical protein C7458_1125 [Williamsia marianensis]